MSWLAADDVTSGIGTGTGAALINPWTGSASRAVFSMSFDANPGTVVAPTEWGTTTSFVSITGTLYLVTIIAGDDFAGAQAGETYTFTWTNSVSFVGGMWAINTLPGAGAFIDEILTLDEESSGSGGPANWTLPDETLTFAEPPELGVGFGVHVWSPRGYLRTAGTGTFNTFASVGNWTSEAAISTGSGLLGLGASSFVRANEASASVGARGLTWNGTGSGVGIQQLIKVGRVTDTPLLTPVSPDFYSSYERRRARARALPFMLDSGMLRGLRDGRS